LDTKPKKLATL